MFTVNRYMENISYLQRYIFRKQDGIRKQFSTKFPLSFPIDVVISEVSLPALLESYEKFKIFLQWRPESWWKDLENCFPLVHFIVNFFHI